MSGYAKKLGVGYYFAMQLADSITVHAAGMTPHLNDLVHLEQLPVLIYPPELALYFYTPEITLPALKPFLVSASFTAKEPVSNLTVHDAGGRHSVPVQKFTGGLGILSQAQYIVISLTGAKHMGCLVIPADQLYPAIYTKVYGPAPKAKCEAWVADNCNR